ncbi:MAG: hypothetical protein IKJ01_05035 [Lachnospiraceae bacterium]|nr:hypothetical protein [Lachnospiraceae bacterium]
MNNIFNEICKTQTPTESCKGFCTINYTVISNTKASRLCKIDTDITPEPYVVEVVSKIEENKMQYKAYTFSDKQKAIEFQNSLCA